MSEQRDTVSPTAEQTRAELWIQPAPSVRAEYEPVLRRLGRLVRRGVIDSFDVNTWGRYLDPADDANVRERDHFASFAHWTWEHGGDLPGTERVLVGTGRGGPEHVVQRTPLAVLAEYEDDVLVRVTPGLDERCLIERLDRLAEDEADLRAELRSAGRSLGTLAARREATRPRRRRSTTRARSQRERPVF